jgi:hypothetical protein
VNTNKFSEDEAREARKPKKLCPPGQRRGTVLEATEGVSPKGNETLRAVIGIIGPDGTEYRLIDVMSATPLGALKLRHFCVACDAEAEFDAGHIDASLFIGREVMATVATERKRGFQPRAVISDYAPVAGAVVTPLRAAGG